MLEASNPLLSRGLRAVFLALLSTLVAAPSGARPQGEELVIAGSVTDAAGAPVVGVRVVLEASHRGFAISRLRHQSEGLVRRAVLSDAAGRFRFDWQWHDYYDSFVVSVVDGTGSAWVGEKLVRVATFELDRPMRRSDQVEIPLVVEDAGFLAAHREFMASLEGDDQYGIYSQMGKPDRVERAGGGVDDEVSWWYFERGRVYRFERGAMTGYEDFTPVRPFD